MRKAARSFAGPQLWVLDDGNALCLVSSGHWFCWHVLALYHAMRGFLQGYAPELHCGVGRSLSSALQSSG